MTGLQLFRVDSAADAGTVQYPETGLSLRWVRVDGIVWLHFADLCKGTGHSNPSAAINLVEDEDKKKFDLNEVFAGHAALRNVRAGTTRGNSETWFVNEDGFTTLGLAGRGDGPRMFRRWIVKVVLPQFRQQQLPARSGDDLDVIEGMVRAIRADRARIAVLEQEQAVTAAKVAAIEGRHDEFTALAYAKLNGHQTGRVFLQRVGIRATAIMREQDREPHKRQDATFGAINVYPVDVLEQAFAAVTS